MFVTLLGMDIEDSPLQLKNAISPIDVILSGKVTEAKLLQLVNAFLDILFKFVK